MGVGGCGCGGGEVAGRGRGVESRKGRRGGRREEGVKGGGGDRRRGRRSPPPSSSLFPASDPGGAPRAPSPTPCSRWWARGGKRFLVGVRIQWLEVKGVQYSGGGLSDSGGTMGAQMINQLFSTQGIFGRA